MTRKTQSYPKEFQSEAARQKVVPDRPPGYAAGTDGRAGRYCLDAVVE